MGAFKEGDKFFAPLSLEQARWNDRPYRACRPAANFDKMFLRS